MKRARHLSNLHCVVVIYSGDRCMWRQNPSFYLSTYLNKIYVTVRSKSNP